MLWPSTQTTIQSDVKTGHSDDEAEVEKTDPNSSLLALASLSTKLLKEANQTNIPAFAQDISPEEHIPNVDLDPPLREMSPSWYSK